MSTTPGVNGNGPINADGFYLVNGRLFSDTTPIVFPGAGVDWPSTTVLGCGRRGHRRDRQRGP